MATGTLFYMPITLAETTNNDPSNGALLYFYLAGTATPVSVYRDVGLSSAYTYPITANAYGRFDEIYLTPGVSYKVDLQSSAGVSLSGYPADNVSAIPLSTGNLDVMATAGENLTAGLVCYLSDGSGSKTAGKWYVASSANNYSCTTPDIGFCIAAIATNDSGLIRVNGRMTGLSGLTAGTTYYITTAGALTSTPGVLNRAVGQADSTTSLVMFGSQPSQAIPNIDTAINEFRLSLTTAVPVTVSDVTAATTIFMVPYKGNRIALYDAAGNAFIYTSAQISIAVPATTATAYDVFCYQNAGVPTLELLAWTNVTTRATALVTNVVTGVETKSGDATRRYIGSFVTTAVSGQTEDSMRRRLISNRYNRVQRALQRIETTNTWTYTTAAYQQANASATNEVDVMIGVQDVLVELTLTAFASNGAGAVNLAVAVGLDSTTVATTPQAGNYARSDVAATIYMMKSTYNAYTAVGYHALVWLEKSTATDTTTWRSNGSDTLGACFSGLIGWTQG